MDPISGELVNCDGTPYAGSGAGGGAGGDFLAEGEQVYVDVAACQACHGDQGQGVCARLSPEGLSSPRSAAARTM